MKQRFNVISPVDGSVYLTMERSNPGQIARTLDKSQAAAKLWRSSAISERIDLVEAFVSALEAKTEDICESLTMSMGRPSRYASFEVSGTAERARYMAGIAQACLADKHLDEKAGFKRYIRREPLGVVMVLSPWNYPYLCAVNAVVPAILSGNSVILKHSEQTPMAAEHFGAAFKAAGLPDGLFQVLHMSHEATALVLGDDCIDHVCFTGSVAGGAAVSAALAKRTGRKRFIGAGLELGGKDAAYVRADADLAVAAAGVVEGALFNSGQSCCGVERVYVHKDVAAEFIERAVNEAKTYVLGDPREQTTTLGPMVRQRNADMVRGQLTQALEAGAHPHLDAARFSADRADTPYLAPQILSAVDHSMPFMTEETFGPCMGIMTVSNDDEAIALINDSDYGLTASIWSPDLDQAEHIGDQLETGTVFLNRCDYLDPALAWTGVKNTGRGTTLSSVGFEHLSRAKSFHLRTGIS
jgi:acyl-CoA reductase-like NAD-dependent aldehyde dehydrogenase